MIKHRYSLFLKEKILYHLSAIQYTYFNKRYSDSLNLKYIVYKNSTGIWNSLRGYL